ncbi:hypothetical protein DRO38_06710, partial [Candidatus Bathyarchaeota archaeon]
MKIRYTSYDEDSAENTYSAALDPEGDIVLEQTKYLYDASGNTIKETRLERFHTHTGTSDLEAGSSAVPSYRAMAYDVLGRLRKVEERGYQDSASGALITQYEYHFKKPDEGGRYETTVDPKGTLTRHQYDNLGRRTKIIRNYIDGSPAPGEHDRDQVVEYKYGPPGGGSDPFRVEEVWVTDTVREEQGTEGTVEDIKVQKTKYVYGVKRGTGEGYSDIDSGRLLYRIMYPDPDTGEPGADARYWLTFAYDRQGRLKWKKDQAISADNPDDATKHGYFYDSFGNLTEEHVTPRSDLDGTMDTVYYNYNRLGRLVSVYAEDRENPQNKALPLNEVVYEYNGWGQVTKSYQEHEGRKDAETFSVEYIYSDDARSLLEGVRYPGDGSRTLLYYYTTGTAEYQKAGLYLGRVQKIAFPGSGGTIVSYRYSGAWRPVERKLEIPGVSIRFDEDGVPSSQSYYDGLDRFGRVKDLCVKTQSATYNHLVYGYDAASNVTSRTEQAVNIPSESYVYDGLDRLSQATFARGSSQDTKQWQLSLNGNWREVKENGSAVDTRYHNAQNEIKGRTFGQAPVPEYDMSGNMTKVPDDAGTSGYVNITYDAWN